ncbi:DUF2760 domain-containing protein [Alienimonas californiensis]|uniref:DUF2760 domain-containing protein n=1 Tax=Alienimonas californiensis TaxID=2527989 RepID=A0A517P9P0_9PLAN|nr:DUF2760 domain-containing protein [Alienimonas californiensis]QDT16096.1 hypothetical protein CA12_21940 [Alienimonas californiensis]
MLKPLALIALPAALLAGAADWYADDAGGPAWIDAVVGTLAVFGTAAGVAALKPEPAPAPAKPQATAAPAKPAPPPKPVKPPEPKRPEGEDALVLLATLQREARLIDFLKEDLSAYDDAQVGAAVRDVHRDAAAALDRLFALGPAVNAEEGSRVDPASLPAGRVKTTGHVGGGAGTLVHPGWAATKVNLPARTGPPDEAAARVLAPAEVEVG